MLKPTPPCTSNGVSNTRKGGNAGRRSAQHEAFFCERARSASKVEGRQARGLCVGDVPVLRRRRRHLGRRPTGSRRPQASTTAEGREAPQLMRHELPSAVVSLAALQVLPSKESSVLHERSARWQRRRRCRLASAARSVSSPALREADAGSYYLVHVHANDV